MPAGRRGWRGQGPDRPQRLTGDAERLPARRQDPQPSALPEHAVGEPRRRLDDVLTVVQDQQRLPLADRGDEPVHRVRARRRAEQCIPQPERGESRLCDVTVGADGRELHQPDPVGQVAEQGLRGLRCQPGLARAARPDQRGQPVLGDEVADLGDVGVPADEAGQLRAHVGPVVFLPMSQLTPQQRDVQGRQLRRGVDAQCVGQGFPGAFVGEQRLGLATSGNEGTHEGGNQPISHRMRGHQVGQLPDQLRTVAEADLRLEPILHRTQSQPLESSHRRVECCAVVQRDILQGRTAPQTQGLAELSCSPGLILLASLTHEAFEPHGVDGVGFHRQAVAAVLSLDHALRQRLPQPGDQALQGVRRVGGRVLTPDPVDQRGPGNEASRLECEGDQQRAQTSARNVGHDTVVPANLEGSEHPDLHHSTFPRWAPPR